MQLIEYIPEYVGKPKLAIQIEQVHGWLEEQADEIEEREMHSRRRYWIDGGERAGGSLSSSDRRSDSGMVEVVDPVSNVEFCANCRRVLRHA